LLSNIPCFQFGHADEIRDRQMIQADGDKKQVLTY
jgi:hypothetical protein